MNKTGEASASLTKLAERDAIEQAFRTYFKKCRNGVSSFAAREFSWGGAWRLRKKGLVRDLTVSTLNVLLAVPAVFLRRGVTFFEKNGYHSIAKGLNRIPTGIKTSYQKEIERKIWSDLFGLSAFPEKRRDRERAIDSFIEREFSSDFKTLHLGQKLAPLIEAELEEFFSKRAYVADLISAGVTCLSAWYLFHDSSLGIWDLGRKIANRYARKKATSNFFLGESLGRTYYSFAAVRTTREEIFWASCLILISLTAIAVLASYLSEPIQLALGIQKRQLEKLVDSLEDKVLLAILRLNSEENAKIPVKT